MFYGVTERRDGVWCLPRDGPRRGTVNEQISTPSGLAALFMGKQEGRQGAEVLPFAWGRMDGGHWGGERWVPPGVDVGGPGGSCRWRIRSRDLPPKPLGSSTVE